MSLSTCPSRRSQSLLNSGRDPVRHEGDIAAAEIPGPRAGPQAIALEARLAKEVTAAKKEESIEEEEPFSEEEPRVEGPREDRSETFFRASQLAVSPERTFQAFETNRRRSMARHSSRPFDQV